VATAFTSTDAATAGVRAMLPRAEQSNDEGGESGIRNGRTG
jgi:hypothetical protein